MALTSRWLAKTSEALYEQIGLRSVEDGYMYEVIANGIRNMPGYAQQIPVADRWAIVAYLRALQRSQYAQPGDVPSGALSNAPSQTAASPTDAG